MAKIPPPIVDCSKLIAFAVNDKDVVYTGRQCLLVGSVKNMKPLGEQAGIVIIHPYNMPEEYLMGFCNRNWRVKGVSAHKTVEEAKRQCEMYYAGISTKWQESPYTEEDILNYAKSIKNEFGYDPMDPR